VRQSSPMSRSVRLGAAAAAAIGLYSACSAQSLGGPGASCASSADCSPGLVCAGEVCVLIESPPCDLPCPGDYDCGPGACPRPCKSNCECGPDAWGCVQHVCVYGPINPGEFCEGCGGSGGSGARGGSPACTSDADCGAGCCIAGSCCDCAALRDAPACKSDCDCVNGDHCYEGSCISTYDFNCVWPPVSGTGGQGGANGAGDAGTNGDSGDGGG